MPIIVSGNNLQTENTQKIRLFFPDKAGHYYIVASISIIIFFAQYCSLFICICTDIYVHCMCNCVLHKSIYIVTRLLCIYGMLIVLYSSFFCSQSIFTIFLGVFIFTTQFSWILNYTQHCIYGIYAYIYIVARICIQHIQSVQSINYFRYVYQYVEMRIFLVICILHSHTIIRTMKNWDFPHAQF